MISMFSNRGKNIPLLTVLFLALLTGCTGMKYVEEGQHLYMDSKLVIDSIEYISNRAETKSELSGLFTQKPNSKFLWMRPRLCLNGMIREPKKKGKFRLWLKNKVGQTPVVMEAINLPEIGAAIENRLQNRGNFLATSDFQVAYKGKRAKVKCLISPGRPYTLNIINYPEGNQGITGDINELRSESILKQGQTYNLKDFESERSRIDNELKDRGYYYFHSDYLIFAADTTPGNKKINTWMQYKPEMPVEASGICTLKDIYIYDDYSSHNYHPDTSQVGNYFYVSESHKVKPKTVLNFVFLEKDSIYSRTNHYNTLRRLMELGTFKSASARFIPDKTYPGKLNVNVLLTPVKKISLSTEINASVKSDNFAGPGLNLSYKNHNLWGGAELFSLTLAGYFEVQFGGDSEGQFAYEVLLDASLTLPKFVLFKVSKQTTKHMVPQSVLTLGTGIYTRISLYEMYSVNVGLGYIWKPRNNITHEFNPVDISFTNLVESSAEFDEFLADNPTVAKSFEEQFIIGLNYTLTDSRIKLWNRKNSLYFRQSVDLSGNLVGLFATLVNDSLPTPDNPHELLGVPYSQFVKLSSELRYYYTPNKKNQIAWRLLAGYGLPYRNSSTIPYSRQFYVGGTNSIRAFISRSIGPGTYYPPDSTSNINVDQTGEIKLETSLEYRFGIYRFFKGALFVDAGNVWLVNEDEQRPGGKFEISKFYKELAIGSGFGFRFDFNYLLIRLDMAFPLYKPYYPEGDRWVFNNIKVGNPSWRRENIIWNIAIGYPF